MPQHKYFPNLRADENFVCAETCTAFHVRSVNRDRLPSEVSALVSCPPHPNKEAETCKAMQPLTCSSAATRDFSQCRPTKLEKPFLEAAARRDGYSDRNSSWARKTRYPHLSSPSPSSALSTRRATTSGATPAGRKETHIG